MSVESNLAVNRRLSDSTLQWWMTQPAEARTVFTEPPRVRLATALFALSTWIKQGEIEGERIYVWSNGADFDLAILAHAYAQFSMPVPWSFTNTRCFRTFKNLSSRSPKALPFVGVKHNALADAVNQAGHAQAIQLALLSIF